MIPQNVDSDAPLSSHRPPWQSRQQPWIERIRLFTDNFACYFKRHGFVQVPAVKITSRVNRSVFLVGATINVLKPFICQKPIPRSGLFIIQPVIRTRLLAEHQRPGLRSEWSSYWISCGGLTAPSELERLFGMMLEFLRTFARCDSGNLRCDIWEGDEHLLSAAQNSGWNTLVVRGSLPDVGYRHKFGLDDQGVWGRNANIKLIDKAEQKHKIIGNIISIETPLGKRAIEFTLAPSTLFARMTGLDHVLKASAIADIMRITNEHQIKLADCITVIVHLSAEGVRPNSSEMRGRILKRYITSATRLIQTGGVSSEDFMDFCRQYMETEYGTSAPLSSTHFAAFLEQQLE